MDWFFPSIEPAIPEFHTHEWPFLSAHQSNSCIVRNYKQPWNQSSLSQKIILTKVPVLRVARHGPSDVKSGQVTACSSIKRRISSTGLVLAIGSVLIFDLHHENVPTVFQ